MQNLILEKRPGGNKLFPIEYDEAERRVKAGTARRVKDGLYQAKVAEPQMQEPNVAEDSEEETPTVYETKVMTPEEPPKTRRRGRPRKVRSATNDSKEQD